MIRVSENDSGNFTPVDPGVYIARCVKLYDLGTTLSPYKDDKGKDKYNHQVQIMFEIPSEIIEGGEYDGMPRCMSVWDNLSLHENATLRKHLIAWRGKPFSEQELKDFDLKTIVGVPCQIQIIHKKDGKAKIDNIMAMLKGGLCDEQITKSVIFDLEDYLAGDKSVYDELAEKMQVRIDSCNEVQQAIRDNGETPQPPDVDPRTNTETQDDVPF